VRSRFLVVVIGAGIAWATVAVPANGQIQPPADSAAERIALGRKLFEGKGLCFSCHGKNGEGVLSPSTRLAGRPLSHTKVTVTGVAELIKTGVDSAHSTSGQVMPSRGGSRLSDAEVEAVAWYVLELQRRPRPDD
jgi:mono/diheme cytochrome c family protein